MVNLGLIISGISMLGGILFDEGARFIKTHFVKRPVLEAERRLYSVRSQGVSNEGVEFAIGDQFSVLEADGDAVLIEKLGDGSNPYFVSAELLQAISDYQE